MKILTAYISADEGTAIVNGNDVNTQQKTMQLSGCNFSTIVVFGFVCEEYLAAHVMSIKE
jgi:hypothetical protein